MKKHLAKIYATIGFILGFIMAVLEFHPSRSQYAYNDFKWLLYLCLTSIAMAFIKRGQKLDKITSVLFLMVGVFSVNSEVKIVEIAHLVFTGLAVLSGYVGLILNATGKMMKTSAYIALPFAIVLFLGGYFGEWYLVAIAEVVVAVPLLIPFYKKV